MIHVDSRNALEDEDEFYVQDLVGLKVHLEVSSTYERKFGCPDIRQLDDTSQNDTWVTGNQVAKSGTSNWGFDPKYEFLR